MLILDAITRKLQVVLGGPRTTNDCPWTVSYADITTTTTVLGSNNGVTNGTGSVDIVAAPAVSTQRRIDTITVYNADTVSTTVSIIYNDNGTTRVVWKASLDVGDTLQYESGGFFVTDSNGKIKQTGIRGVQGFQGVQGSGFQGNQGFQGTNPGVQGPIGPQGLVGIQGWQGFIGVQGNQGNQGWQGLIGPQGNQGNQGRQGWQGFQGLAGTQGAQGNQGWQGWQGTVILYGTSGPPGPQAEGTLYFRYIA